MKRPQAYTALLVVAAGSWLAIAAGTNANSLSAESAPDPWSGSDLLTPKILADQLHGEAGTPHVISVAFPVLYRNRHIAGAVFAGPGRDTVGLEELKKTVASLPKGAPIVLYCGCCPMRQCPNIRPAFQALKDLGYTHVQVLDIPTNLATDWVDKGYPVQPPR